MAHQAVDSFIRQTGSRKSTFHAIAGVVTSFCHEDALRPSARAKGTLVQVAF
jgi:hypothetical protein